MWVGDGRVWGGNFWGETKPPVNFWGETKGGGATPRGNFFGKSEMVDPTGIEPVTSSMPWKRSTK